MQRIGRRQSCSEEVSREVARVVDIIGFKESYLATVPETFLWAFVHILSNLAVDCNDVKVHSMILRIYRRLFHDYGIDCIYINIQAGQSLRCQNNNQKS